MYERNAVVIDRYFSELFGYNEKNNLNNNFRKYCELVEKLKKYQDISSQEDEIILEVEKVADEIKKTQKTQDILFKKNIKLQETRKKLFEDLGEDSAEIKNKFDEIDAETDKNNSEIKENEEKFINEISEFNAKSITRNQFAKDRRIVENDYRKILNLTTDNFNSINKNKISDCEEFLKQESKDTQKQEIKAQILKNGLKEKVPFNEDVVIKAIEISTDTEEKKIDLLMHSYERTGKLLNELKSENVKLEKYEKNVKNLSSKMKYLNAISEYIVLFLDNERMNVLGGVKEHKKIMSEACINLEKDMVQISNLYKLLEKETMGKATQKTYTDLYNLQYLIDLINEQTKFEKNISKLNVLGTVIYPNYWRVEGMQKIFESFKSIVTEEYGEDLSVYEPVQKDIIDEEDEEDDDDFEFEIKDNKKKEEKSLKWKYTNISEEEDDDESEDDEDSDEEDKNIETEEYEDDYYNAKDSDDEEYENNDKFEELNEYDEFDDNEEEFDEYEDDIEEDDEDGEDDEEYEDDEEDKTVDEILGLYDNNKVAKDDSILKQDETEEQEDKIDFDWDDDEEDDEDEIDFNWNREEKEEKKDRRKK